MQEGVSGATRAGQVDTDLWAGRLARLALLAAFVLTGWLLLLHLRMIVSPAPQEMREGGELWITQLLLQGRNPYSLAELPAGADVYGIGYNAVVAPLAALFANSLTVHRLVSFLAIGLACVLLYRLLRRRGVDAALAVSGTLLFYLASSYFVAPLARPDGLALLLSVAAISLLYDDDPSLPRFLAGLALCIAALFTKLYLAYPVFVICLWIFLFRSRKKGLILGGCAAAAALLSLAAATWLFPAYLNVVVLANAQSADYNVDHLLRQTSDWALFQLPIPVALAVVLGSWLKRERRSAAPGPWAFTVIANSLVILGWLGGHLGAHMTYLLQLVSPAAILSLWPSLPRRGWGRTAVIAALPLALLVNARLFPQSFEEFRRAEAVYAELERAVAAHGSVLGGTEAAAALVRTGRPVLDNGQSEYIASAASHRGLPLLAPPAALARRWDEARQEIADGLDQQRYDLVVRSRRAGGMIPADRLADRYQISRTLELAFPWAKQQWPVDLWVPR
jgi:hypothetical protein